MKKVGIWLRVSTDIQAQSDSPEHHEKRARAYAELKDWEVVTVYHLEAVSGKDVMNHSEAKRMLEDIQVGRISGLIFSKIARLARNTVHLLQISTIFEEHKADLISLEENIDTTSPVGKFYFTLTSAMAQWEREEIASRVKASVKVRAKLGKPLGGQAPYGYKSENGELLLDEKEAPIRKYLFELFKEHKRKGVVCRILTEEGHRTRKGSKFSPTTVRRLLTDPVAKGMRRVHYTESLGNKKHWKLKPKEEWMFQEAPRIVTDKLWQDVNEILDEQALKSNYPKNTNTHLFTGYAFCNCGGKMVIRTRSPRYVCVDCKRKITPEDLEHIYYTSLTDYIDNETALKELNKEQQKSLNQEKQIFEKFKGREVELQSELNQLLKLNRTGEVPTKGFKKLFTPIFEEHEQVTASVEKKSAEIRVLKLEMKSNANAVDGAKEFYKSWNKLSKQEKRGLIESITKRITIGETDINIQLAGHLPRRRNGYQMGDATMSMRLF